MSYEIWVTIAVILSVTAGISLIFIFRSVRMKKRKTAKTEHRRKILD